MKTLNFLAKPKKNLPFFLSSFLLFSFFVLTNSSYSQTWPPEGMQGDGTESAPWQITTPAHLEALANYVNAGNGNETKGVYYKLMNHIDLSGYAQGEGWQPIGKWISASEHTHTFQGHFNGNGKVIQNLTINRPTQNYIGFFAYTANGAIQNLGIENCNILGKNCVGGLIGLNGGNTNNGSNIIKCYVTGSIMGNHYVGGLLGIESGGDIYNCYTEGKVEGGNSDRFGGLIGSASAYEIIFNCYSTCSVSGNTSVGGLVSGYAIIRNCFAANDSVIAYSSTTDIGRIFTAWEAKNNYARNDMVVRNADGYVPIVDGLDTKDGKGVDYAMFKNLHFYVTVNNWYNGAWDMDSPDAAWRICDGEGLPFLRWQKKGCDTFTITATAGEHGNIDPDGEIPVFEFNSKTFTFTAQNGFKVDSLFIDGEHRPDSIAAGRYTFEEVTENHTIHVTFRSNIGIPENIKTVELTVYPNPTQNKFTVEFAGNASVFLYNLVGKEILTQHFSDAAEISISHLPTGIYYLYIVSEGHVMGTSKIIKY